MKPYVFVEKSLNEKLLHHITISLVLPQFGLTDAKSFPYRIGKDFIASSYSPTTLPVNHLLENYNKGIHLCKYKICEYS